MTSNAETVDYGCQPGSKNRSNRRYLRSLKVAEGHLVERGEGLQLDEIDPSLPGFTLRNEGLGLLHPHGGLRLGQIGLQPRLLEPEPELGIGGMVIGALQGQPTVRP
jgi:hypothetical protein